MKRSLAVLLLLVASELVAWARDPDPWFISPGIKLGYAFGEKGGFSFGWEVSVFTWTRWDPDGSRDGVVGVVFDMDRCRSTTKFHIGIEGSQRLVGVSIGPTFITQDQERFFGFTATVYSWYVLYPYFSYTYVGGGTDVGEVGAYLKLPIPLTKADLFKM
jgi:hypothetical protein